MSGASWTSNSSRSNPIVGDTIAETVSRSPLGDRLIAVACRFYGADPLSIKSKRRRGNVSKVRWAVTHALFHDAHWQKVDIAELLQQDHTAVGYALDKAEQLRRTDEVFWDLTKRLYNEIHIDTPV